MYNHSSFVKVGGGKLYYEIINPSFINKNIPFLVFLHEGLGSCKQWKDFPQQISDEVKYPALIYDRFGYGKSEEIKESQSQNILFDEALVYLPELLKKIKIKNKIILIGHSDGGSIGLLFASNFPKRVSGLITESDHVKIEEISVNGLMKAVVDFENGNLREFLLKYHEKKTDSMFYNWSGNWLSENGKSWNIEKYLTSIKCPVLAIQGHNDQYGSIEQLISKLKNIKGTVEILYLENCGHVPHFQSKEIVFNRIIRFILTL